jgi:hypothetical protein
MGIKPKRTRPYRPRTNGKIERFHRTMADGWAFRRMFPSELARRQALPAWLHEYNRRVRLFACSRVSALQAETKGLRWFARLQPAAGWLAQRWPAAAASPSARSGSREVCSAGRRSALRAFCRTRGLRKDGYGGQRRGRDRRRSAQGQLVSCCGGHSAPTAGRAAGAALSRGRQGSCARASRNSSR